MDNMHEVGKRRDAGSLKIVGCFFVVLGSLVLLGTISARDDQRGMIVNFCSGALIVVIGIGMLWISRRIRASLDDSRKASQAP